MPGPPRLWTWITTEWCPLPSRLSWVLWRALIHAWGSTATRWRDAFLAFDREDKLVSSDIVETFLGEIASPQQFIDLLEALVQENY